MPDIQPIVMPKWGLAMQEGTLAKWSAEEGEPVAVGQEIMDIETSKIANVFESPVEGVLEKAGRAGWRGASGRRASGRRRRQGVTDGRSTAFVADFQAQFASAGEGRCAGARADHGRDRRQARALSQARAG